MSVAMIAAICQSTSSETFQPILPISTAATPMSALQT